MNREERSQIRSEMRELANQINELIESIRKQSRDFHGRLCALEEKYIQMMQRMLEKK